MKWSSIAKTQYTHHTEHAKYAEIYWALVLFALFFMHFFILFHKCLIVFANVSCVRFVY